MNEIIVYLSGPMYLGWDQATKWRDDVKQVLAGHEFRVIDPCNRWLEKGPQLSDAGPWVVQMDKLEIAKSNVVLVNGTDPGWGTPMEQYIAWSTGKFVVAFSECEYPSIWTKAHAHKICKNHKEAAEFLVSIKKHLARVV